MSTTQNSLKKIPPEIRPAPPPRYLCVSLIIIKIIDLFIFIV